MSKDLLSEATRALRETSEVSELEARATRARVLSSLHQTRVTRRTRWVFLLPIAATFLAVSAWGAASGRARVVLDGIEQLLAPVAPSPSTPAPRQRATSVTAQAAPPPTVDVPAPSAASVEAALPRTAAQPLPALEPTAPASAARSPRPVQDRALELYRAAHTAHFVDHDPARALAAWDAYLSAAPSGPFAPEAHYNRALSLVRLGRNDEARSALQPFARGAFAGYRQAEATALLSKLEQVRGSSSDRDRTPE